MDALTKADIHGIITTIRVNYPNAYNFGDEEKRILIESWYAILSAYPKQIVMEATHQAIKHNKFPPNVAAIVEQIGAMQRAMAPLATALWDELSQAYVKALKLIGLFGCTFREHGGKTQGEQAREDSQTLYTGLTQELRDYCGSWRGFLDNARAGRETGYGWEKTQFLKLIPEIVARNNTLIGMSRETKQFLAMERAKEIEANRGAPQIGYKEA